MNDSKIKNKECIEIVNDEDKIVEILLKNTGDNYYTCIQCGTCTSGCPVTSYGLNIRKINKSIILGMDKNHIYKTAIWYCTNCEKCGEICPKKLKSSNLITYLRRIQIKERKIPDSFKEMLNNLKKYGRILKIDEASIMKREKLNLPEIEIKINEKILDELKIIFDEFNIEEILKID